MNNSNDVNIFIVDYACGFHKGVCDIDYVSKLRTRSALRALKKYPNAYIVLGAGMANVTCGCGTLSSMIEAYLVHLNIPTTRILINDIGFNTKTETEAAYAIISKYNNFKVVCATSGYHALRVWMIWLCRFGIAPEMFISHYSLPVIQQLNEYIKIIPDAILSLLRRFN